MRLVGPSIQAIWIALLHWRALCPCRLTCDHVIIVGVSRRGKESMAHACAKEREPVEAIDGCDDTKVGPLNPGIVK